MTNPEVRLALVLPRIDQRDYFIHLFGLMYTVIIDHCNPDVVVYDDYSWNDIPKYTHSPLYVAFTGESMPIDYARCELALSFDESHPKGIYLPLWVLFVDWFNTKNKDLCQLADIMTRPHKTSIDRQLFCGFVARNSAKVRKNFVHKLSEYKTVTCPGKVLNNYPEIGGRMGRSKEMFLRRCKFTIAFENISKPGYITEKLLHAFQSRTIPIYWGSPTVTRYFNPKAFINCQDYPNWDAVIAEIIRIDKDDFAYLAMLNEPVFVGDMIPMQFWPSSLISCIKLLTRIC